MFWKNTGLVCIVLGAMGIVSYGQTTKPRAHSTNLQGNLGYLGVGLQDVTPEVAKALGLKEASGLLVTAVDPEVGARAGIHFHDVIVEYNGQKVTSGDDFTNSIMGKAPGTKINLIILRGNTKQNLTATLGARPFGLPLKAPAPPLGVAEQLNSDDMQMAIAAMNAITTPRLGFYVHDMMPQLSVFFGVHDGVLVESVDPGSSAEKAGLKAGDVVTKVNGIPVGSEREVIGLVRQSGRRVISFTVFRNKKEMTLSVELACNQDLLHRGEINRA